MSRSLGSEKNSDNTDYAFSIQESMNQVGTVKANVGGVDMSLIIDSGASCML